MKVRRHLLNLAAVVSLVLCVTTAALSVRSYRSTDQFGRWRRWEERSLLKERCYGLVSQDGAVVAVSLTRHNPSVFGREGYGYTGSVLPKDLASLPPVFDKSGWIENPARWNEVRFRDVEGGLQLFGLCYDDGFGGRG